MSLLTRLWLLTHHVFSSTQTNRGAITNGDRGIKQPAHRKPKILPARMPCHRWIPRAWASPAVLIPVPRGAKTCIHRRTFISSPKW